MDVEWHNQFSFLLKIYGICCGTFGSLSLILNFTIVIIFIYNTVKTKFKKSNFTLCFQSIIDIIGAASMILDSFIHLNYSPPFIMYYVYADTIGDVWGFLFRYSSFIAIITLLVITMERYLSVRHPFVHRTKITSKVVTIAVLLVFFCPSIPATVSVLYIAQSHDQWYLKQMIYLITIGVITLSILITVYTMLIISYLSIRSFRSEDTWLLTHLLSFLIRICYIGLKNLLSCWIRYIVLLDNWMALK